MGMEELERNLKALREAMAELKTWADSQRGSDHLSFLTGPLCHYTDVAGLKGILETEELWLTSALHLNDPTEISFGREVAQEILKSYDRPGGEDSDTAYLAETIGENALTSNPGIYPFSFSRCRDDLSQWRAYGDNGRGVCIEFKPDVFALAKTEFFGGGILYGNDEAKRRHSPLIEKTLEIISQREAMSGFFLVSVGAFQGVDLSEVFKPFQEMFIWNCLFTKHEAYQAERELRFAVVGAPDELRQRIKTRVRGSEIVPYIPLKLTTLKMNGIAQIQLGPAADRRALDGIRHLLRQHEYDEALLVHQSTIPYRVSPR